MNFTYVALVLALFAAALAEADQNTARDDLAMAERTLKVDNIHDGHVVEVVGTQNEFVFTYCRKGSTALSQHTVVSTDEPDAKFASAKVVKDMVIDRDSEQCRQAN
jgi:hypothetical protein